MNDVEAVFLLKDACVGVNRSKIQSNEIYL